MNLLTNKFGRVNYLHVYKGDVTMGNMTVEAAEKFFEKGEVSTEIPDEMKCFDVTHCVDGEYYFTILPEKKVRKKREQHPEI